MISCAYKVFSITILLLLHLLLLALSAVDSSGWCYGEELSQDTLPDYADALPDAPSEPPPVIKEDTVPQSSGLGAADDSTLSAKTYNQSQAQKKTIWADGIIGLTFPLFVIGDFSIYRQTGNDPFEISFGHESMTGYNNKPLQKGYFDHATHIDAEKTFSRGAHTVFINAFYNSNDTGLQSKSDYITDVAKINLGAKVQYIVNFKEATPKSSTSFALDTTLGLSWYARYGNFTQDYASNLQSEDESLDIEGFEKKLSIFAFTPNIVFRWGVGKLTSSVGCNFNISRDTDNIFTLRNSGRLDTFLTVRYNFITASQSGEESMTGESDTESEKVLSKKSNKPSGWQRKEDTFENNVFSLFGRVAAITSNVIGDHVCLVPFNAGLDMRLVTGLSTKRASIILSGGLDTASNGVGNTEKQYMAAVANSFFDDTSDWFCKLDFALPIKEMFTFNLAAQFRTTALDLGYYVPYYDRERSVTRYRYGQYLFDCVNMNQVNTSVMVSFSQSLVTCYLDWVSYWVDVPITESTNKLIFNIALQDKSSRVSFSSNIAFFFGENADYSPKWDFELSVRTTNSLSLSLMSRDFIKLVTDDTRDFCDSVYIERGGLIGIAAKFIF